MKTTMVNTETSATYNVAPLPSVEEEILEKALSILRRRYEDKVSRKVCRPEDVAQLLIHEFAGATRETFGVMLLDSQHHVIDTVELTTGTIDSATVYPREVVASVLQQGAAAVVFYHNHPSGDPSPSQADKTITQRLAKALDLIDVRTLDHIIIGAASTFSFAEKGLI